MSGEDRGSEESEDEIDFNQKRNQKNKKKDQKRNQKMPIIRTMPFQSEELGAVRWANSWAQPPDFVESCCQ